MSSETLFEILVRLTSLSVGIQAIEMMNLKSEFQKGGVFFESSPSFFFRILCNSSQFLEAIRVLFCVSICVWPTFPSSGLAVYSLLILTFLTHLKTFGRFNGGSDSITWVTLVGICLGFWFWDFSENKPNFKIALTTIGVFSLISYLQAGIVKIRNGEWLTGKFFLQGFKLGKIYGPRAEDFFKSIKNKKSLNRILGTSVVFFEISSIGVLFSTEFSFVFLVAGMFFHLGVFYLFGLNRFFWAWLATYPAVLYLGYLEPGKTLFK